MVNVVVPRMIGGATDGPAPRLRTEFALDTGHGEVERADLRLTAYGLVEATLNGTPASPHLLTPGWTSYEWRLRVAEHRVEHLLADRTVLGLTIGNGWFRGRLGWDGARAFYGPDRGGWAELEIVFADGHVQRVVTDGTWRTAPSGITADDLYDGQTVDARGADDGWTRPGFDDSAWGPARELDLDPERLAPYLGPQVSRQQELAPQRIWTSPAGRTLVDFGQNLVGFVRVRVRGPVGSEVVLRHAEVLERGELGVRPLRTAQATDRYVLSGGDDVFEPTFTFHGFRYAEVEGWPGEPEPDALIAVVIGSELERIGRFSCSDPLLNRLHENVVRSMRGNFVDVPTDCPQRDERLGWTGDIAAFAPTAAFLYDVGPFLRDWLVDVAAEQAHQDGVVPFVVPDVLKYHDRDRQPPADSTALWSDAAVWVPWTLWRAYGDRRVLEDQFESMRAHVRRVRGRLSSSGVWDTGFQFGDWLDPDAPPDDPAASKVDVGVVATACIARSARIVAETAALLGRAAEQEEFATFADRLRDAFRSAYVEGGRIRSDAPTGYALAIAFDLLEPGDRAAAGGRLAELVEANGYRVSTGFAGTPFICDALSATGHLDAAYRLLTEREVPSWLYPVTMGATTVWERWDSMLPDGTINPGEMTSFNHYAFGAVADWMHRVLGGLAAEEPGWSRIRVAPRPGGGVTSAETSLRTPHGTAAVSWALADDRLAVDVLVPDGARAVLDLPGVDERILGPGSHHAEVAHALP